MILDSQEQLALNQSIVSAVGDVVSTNAYDTGSVGDIGIGEELFIHAQMGTTAGVGAGASVQAVLQTADDVAFATNLTEFPMGPIRGVAALTANSILGRIDFPIGMRRFFRVVFRVSGAAITAGTATAFVVKNEQANNTYPSGFTVA